EVADDAVGGLLAMPVVDTLKRVRGGDPAMGADVETVTREQMWQAQTPQMFRKGLLQQALQACPQVTDEASAIEAMQLPIRLVAGALRNRKLTVPEDVEFLSLYFNQEQ
ncbi:MAG: 2-C-methyl-D-erythritol 4-phosphate cytidylyltransferase, partial [Burkholderiales bacterium]|nr:2-C-methyl-D-erythritol 4-phosphate cytidylyltransferase [Burkholderiales bacterium]